MAHHVSPQIPAPDMLDPALSDADLAAALVRGAAGIALRMRDIGVSAVEKTSISDVVTDADTSAESYVVWQLRRCRPDDSILGEEGAAHTGTSGRTWVIDPVDGTYNFFSGSTYWCSALALTDGAGEDLTDAEVLIGAIFQPQEDRLWLGGRDHPATLNGLPIHTETRDDVGQLSAGTYIHPSWLAQPQAAGPWQQAAVLPATLRMFGSGSCDLGRVAQAELGAWFQHSCPAWDWLPGKAIVRAAGGHTAVVRVNGLDWFVAGPAGAVAQLGAALRFTQP